MLALATARQPAPMLARGAVGLRRLVRPKAFGNALGQGLVDGMGSPDQTGANARSDLNKFNRESDEYYNAPAQGSPAGAVFNWDDADMDGGAHVPTPEQSQAMFRQLERDYRQATDTGAEVRKGDTLWKLSGYDKEVFGRLVKGMNLPDPNSIQVGQVMRQDAGLSRDSAIAVTDDFFRADGLAKTLAAQQRDSASEVQREFNRFAAMTQGVGQVTGAPAFEQRLLQPGESIKGNLFFGGAGMDGAYIKDMVRAFGDKGIALTPVDREKWSGGTLLDASVGVDIYREGKFQIQVLLDNFHQTGSQFNLVGYSYGSVAAAQVAINYAQAGTQVDNLVLVGSPVGEKFLNELQSTPNIKNVVVINLTEQGDPIHAGMTRNELLLSAPTLATQMVESSGHFYYAPSTADGQARRDDLAAYLYSKGVR